MDFEQKVIVVTGAASGIGLGITRALIAAGASVALADNDAARLERVVAQLREAGGTVCGVELDVTDPEQWVAAADRAEQALGPYSQLDKGAKHAVADGHWTFQSLFTRRYGIAGGTDQIQLNIIGERQLGLPK